MTWARIYPIVSNWPGGGTPPVFDISSDVDGTAVVELAWDPQALRNPASYPQPLRYYGSDVTFLATVRTAAGGTLPVSVPAQTITVTGNRARWTMPASLWAGLLEESLKSISSPPATTFSGNLYYRVRVTGTSSGKTTVWPPDATLTGPNARQAPRIGILAMSGSPFSQVGLDVPAVQAMGGLPGAPTFWADLLTSLWNALPETDSTRQGLVVVMAHPTYKALPVGQRSQVLRLWLVSGRARSKIPALLSRQVPVPSGAAPGTTTIPMVSKPALKGGKNLIGQLLDLVAITPHPDLQAYALDQLVDDVMSEVLDPNGQVNQGAAGTCAPTSVQAMLIGVNPAEYARLQVGWLSSAAQAELADGSTADVPAGIFQIARYNGTGAPTGNTTNVGFLLRTFSEMAFQGAMLAFGQGSSFPSFDGSEASLQRIFNHVVTGGLTRLQTKSCLEALFKTTFSSSLEAWPPSSIGFTVTQLNIQLNLALALKGKGQPVLLNLYWGVDPATAPPSGTAPNTFYGGHAVVAARDENGRVYFKNPQYAGSNPVPGYANGGNETNPPRRHEEVSQSLESLTEADLMHWVLSYLAPDNAII